MDGHFVPNITFGAPVVDSLRKRCSAFLDCHLMVTEPWQWVDAFAAAGASGFTFHLEVVSEGAWRPLLGPQVPQAAPRSPPLR